MGVRLIRGWLGLWAGLCLGVITVGATVEPGMARVNVLQELGVPASAIARGTTEVLTYRNGLRVTLKDGKVTTISGQQPTDTATPTAVVTEEPAAPVLTKAEQEEEARQEKIWAAQHAKAQDEMEKSLNDLENMHGNTPQLPGLQKFNLRDFIVGIVLKWVLCLVALKLTCKYWGFEVFWSGLMIAALTDTAARALVSFAGLMLLHLSSLFYADEAVGAFALVLVLRKVSINQSMAQAVQITMTTKVFTVVVGSFLVTMMLQLLH